MVDNEKIYIIRTKYLRYVSKKIDISNFLKQLPFSSNYVIENWYGSCWPLRVDGEVDEISKEHYRSHTPLERHIRLKKLTDKCEIGLTKLQYDELIALINKYNTKLYH